MRELKVYQATRNSTGVNEVVLLVDRDYAFKVKGKGIFMPPAKLENLGTTNDWRLSTYSRTRAEALAEYRALEISRIRAATQSLELVSAA